MVASVMGARPDPAGDGGTWDGREQSRARRETQRLLLWLIMSWRRFCYRRARKASKPAATCAGFDRYANSKQIVPDEQRAEPSAQNAHRGISCILPSKN